MVEHESGGERTFILLGGEALKRGGKMIKSPNRDIKREGRRES